VCDVNMQDTSDLYGIIITVVTITGRASPTCEQDPF